MDPNLQGASTCDQGPLKSQLSFVIYLCPCLKLSVWSRSPLQGHLYWASACASMWIPRRTHSNLGPLKAQKQRLLGFLEIRSGTSQHCLHSVSSFQVRKSQAQLSLGHGEVNTPLLMWVLPCVHRKGDLLGTRLKDQLPEAFCP